MNYSFHHSPAVPRAGEIGLLRSEKQILGIAQGLEISLLEAAVLTAAHGTCQMNFLKQIYAEII